MSESTKTPKTLQKGWWISLGIVAVVAILAIIIFVNPAPKNPAPIAEPTVTSTAEIVSGCNVPEGDTSSKPAIPTDLRWEAAKGTTWPVSDTYGPTREKDGYGTCFARSPLGAALAMATFYGMGSSADPKKATEIYVMDSAGKTAALNEPDSPSVDSASGDPVAFAGFSTDSFTPDEAQITLVIAIAKSPTGYVGLPSTLVWVEGDWKLKILDNGQTSAGEATKPVAGQFTPWGGSRG